LIVRTCGLFRRVWLASNTKALVLVAKIGHLKKPCFSPNFQQQSPLAIGWVVIYNDKNMLGIISDHVPSQNAFFLSFHDTMQSSHSEYQTYNA